MWVWKNRKDPKEIDEKEADSLSAEFGDLGARKKIAMILNQKDKAEDFTEDNVKAYVKNLNAKAIEHVNAHLKKINAGFTVSVSQMTSVECSINLPTGLKSPDPDTGKIFNLLTKESIAVYQAALKDVATLEWKEKDKCLLIKPNDKSGEIEVYASHMTLPNPTEDGLKIMADAYMAAVDKAQVKKELWIDADDEATKFLTKYCQDKGYIIVKKPEIQPDKKPLVSEPQVEPLKEESSNTILRF